MSEAPALLEVRGLCKTYPQGHWWQRQLRVKALDNLHLTLKAGSTLALAGESGAGKTTLAMCLVGLEQPDAGEIRFEGKSLLALSRKQRRAAQRGIQLIFQDSAGALNPRMSAQEIVEEPLLISQNSSRKERIERVSQMMERVGLPSSSRNRRPHEFSGGQRQRLAIARALVLRPKLLILDEALAGLDLSIQGQIANLLSDMQLSEGLSYLHISHNLELVARIADEVALIHQGRLIERVSSSPSTSKAFAHCSQRRVEAVSTETLAEDLALGAKGGALA